MNMSKRWQQLKSNSNPLFVPFFKGGIFFLGFLTPLWKRGEGEIFRRMTQVLYSELQGQDARALPLKFVTRVGLIRGDAIISDGR